jgi:hypothetical protein
MIDDGPAFAAAFGPEVTAKVEIMADSMESSPAKVASRRYSID